MSRTTATATAPRRVLVVANETLDSATLHETILASLGDSPGVGFGHRAELHLELFVDPAAYGVDEGAKLILGHYPHYRDGWCASQASKTAQIQARQQLDGCRGEVYNGDLSGGYSFLRGRPRFDGDTVSQDACRGPSPSLIRWKQP